MLQLKRGIGLLCVASWLSLLERFRIPNVETQTGKKFHRHTINFPGTLKLRYVFAAHVQHVLFFFF